MKGSLRCVCMFAAMALAGRLHSISASDESTDAATRAAQSWLVLVDSGKYTESWDEAAQVLKKQITKEEWVKKLNSFRFPLGKMESRTLKSSVSYTKSLPGTPEAQYMIIQYDANFERGRSSVETVTPTKEQDGQWRISGYSIDRQ
jgi:Protein of unknown function (DUF4019)